MSRVRGLELLFNLIKSQIQSKFDCAVAAVHCLLTNEGLQCCGIGETFSEDDRPSELLPTGWNSNQDVYTLRYIGKKPNGKFLLKAVRTGNHILHANVVFEEDTAATMTINVDKMISDSFEDYNAVYLDLPALISNFQSEILVRLFIGTARPSAPKSKGSDERPVQPSASPGKVSNPRPQDPLRVGPSSLPQVGGRDLDPLGRDQGGMFFDPMLQPNLINPRIYDPSGFGVPPFGGPGGLPRGSVPPGVRFDPYGPPIRGPNRPGPSPDHFKPPDFDDFL